MPTFGYKGFKYADGRLCCRDQTYEIGVPVKLTEPRGPMICKRGFHYCSDLADVLDHYIPSPDHVYGRVENLAPDE